MKSIDKDYKGANIISFLFPIVGLIIYAINIGKNHKLANDCLKWALFGIGAYVLLLILFIWGSEAFFVVMFWVILFIVLYFIVKKFSK